VYCDFAMVVLTGNQIREQLAGLAL